MGYISPSSTGIPGLPTAWRLSSQWIQVECVTPYQWSVLLPYLTGWAMGCEELVPANAHSRRSRSPLFGVGSVELSWKGLKKRMSTNVCFGLVRTRVDVG